MVGRCRQGRRVEEGRAAGAVKVAVGASVAKRRRVRGARGCEGRRAPGASRSRQGERPDDGKASGQHEPESLVWNVTNLVHRISYT